MIEEFSLQRRYSTPVSGWEWTGIGSSNDFVSVKETALGLINSGVAATDIRIVILFDTYSHVLDGDSLCDFVYKTVHDGEAGEAVDRPARYQKGGLDVIAYMYSKSREAGDAFCEGSILKYLRRLGEKDTRINELKKAQVFLVRMIEHEEKEEKEEKCTEQK